ncbi:hypothetical protein B0H14DRAFT_2712949 [Mycena olivaceomarginata]|nr:hypothetical protein B0H14DRAFT_2712949 [Mycena olivaceomarginata]
MESRSGVQRTQRRRNKAGAPYENPVADASAAPRAAAAWVKHGHWMMTSHGDKAYLYGGHLEDDEARTPTSDLHCLDISTMTWKNLTNSLRFYIPDPFSTAQIRCLPALTEPAIAIIALNGNKFLLLFGGFSDEGSTTDSLIAIDLDALTWWFVHPEGAPIIPRASAAMVAIGNRIYVFGGKKDRDTSIRTYSIAEYDSKTFKWSWIVSDSPFPADFVAMGTGNIQAIAVYGGQKILLSNGRDDPTTPIQLSGQQTLLFHTQHYTFQDASTTVGDFPKDVGSYNLMLITAWIPHVGGYLVQEFWQYSLPPVETIQCLNRRDEVWDLEIDALMCIAVGDGLFLLGYDDCPVEGDDSDEKVWNVAVRIPAAVLTSMLL